MLTGQTLDAGDVDDGIPPQERRPRNPVTARSGTFHIYASATGSGNVAASVEAVVSISATSEQPYSILYWREPARFQFPVQGQDST